MADTNGKFTAWILGIAGVLTTSGIFVTGATFWSLKSDIAATASAQAAMNERLISIEKDMVQRTGDRYTGSDAARDRTMYAETLNRMNDRVILQESRMSDLLQFKARMEERMKLEQKP